MNTNYQDIINQIQGTLDSHPYQPTRLVKTAPKAPPVDYSAIANMKSGPKSNGVGSSIWDGLVNTLGGVSHVGSGLIHNWMNGKNGFLQDDGNGILDSAGKGIQDMQKKNWFGNIASYTPFGSSLAGLYGLGKYGNGYDKVIEDVGNKDWGMFSDVAKNKNVQKWGGLAGDILLDPLTYLSGGGVAAEKAGVQAGTKLIPKLGAEYGAEAIGKSKNIHKVVDNIIAHHGLDEVAADALKTRVAEHINPAKMAMQNKMFSFNVPFGPTIKNPITGNPLAFGDKAKVGRYVANSIVPFSTKLGKVAEVADKYGDFTKSFAKIGSQGATAVNDLFKEHGINDGSSVLKDVYGVNKASDLRVDQFQHLKDTADIIKRNPDHFVTEGVASPFAMKVTKNVPPVFKTRQQMLKEALKITGKGKKLKGGMTAKGSKSFDKFTDKAVWDMIKNGYKGESKGSQPFAKNIYDMYVGRGMNKPTSLDELIGNMGKGLVDEKWAREGMSPREIEIMRSSQRPEVLQKMTDALAPEKGMNLNRSVDSALSSGKYPKGTTAEDLLNNVNTGKIPDINPVKKPGVSTTTFKNLEPSVHPQFTKDMEKALGSRKFVQDVGGESALGRFLRDKTSMFNPRIIKSDDELARQAGNTVQDAETKIVGGRTQIQHQVDTLNKMAKGMSQGERNAVVHVLENAFPSGYNGLADFASRNGLNSEKIQSLADAMRPLYEQIQKAESKAGVLDGAINDYAPHMINSKVSPDDLSKMVEKYKDDPDIQKLAKMAKMSSGNKSNLERKSFKSFAQLDDKLYRLQKSFAKETDPEKAAAIQEKIDDLSKLFERDPIKAYGQRAYRSIVSRSFKEMQDNLSKDGLMKVITKKDRPMVPAHMDHLTPDDVKALGLDDSKQYYMHTDVKNYLKKHEELFTDKGMNNFLANANAFTNIWKSLVTTHSPVHFVNNLIGNAAVNTMAGIKPQDYREAWNIMKKMKTGDFTSSQKKMFEKATDAGAMSGFLHEFMPSRITNNKWEKMAESVRNNPLAKAISKRGDKADDITRLAHYIGAYRQTGSYEKAAKSMREHLFNYNEMTKADRTMRLIVPFWNWSRRNIPLQVKGLLSQPRYASTYHKVISDLQGDNSNTPDFLKDFGMPLPGGYMTDLRLPVQDLAQFGKGNVSDISNYVFGQLNPLAKAPIEIATNHQFFNQKPIDPALAKNGGNYSSDKMIPYLWNQTGVLGKMYKLTQDDSSSKHPTEDWQKAAAFVLPRIYNTK